jgi:MerR family transcriptional regulator, heat shock protein HspR
MGTFPPVACFSSKNLVFLWHEICICGYSFSLTRRPMRSPEKEETRTYTIGQVAELLGVSVPTLRLYEREGLILPLRRGSGHRVYADTDIQRLHCIRRSITQEKIGIAGMRRMFSLIPCWALKGCCATSRATCPASSSHDSPCWSLANRPAECANADCRSCAVYAIAADCGALKSLLMTLTTTP